MSRSVMVVVPLAFLSVMIIIPAGSRPAAAEKTAAMVPRELLESRRDTARAVFERTIEAQKTRQVNFDASILAWSKLWLDAELELKDKHADRIEAYKAHLDRARQVEKSTATLAEFSQVDKSVALATTYYRIDAEILLRQASDQ